MFSEEQLKKIIEENLSTHYEFGDLTGGSGHMGHRSFSVTKMEHLVKNGKHWNFTFEYSIFVETEFNYYPDNPPQEDSYRKTIAISEDGKIISEENSKYLGGSLDKMEMPDLDDL